MLCKVWHLVAGRMGKGPRRFKGRPFSFHAFLMREFARPTNLRGSGSRFCCDATASFAKATEARGMSRPHWRVRERYSEVVREWWVFVFLQADWSPLPRWRVNGFSCKIPGLEASKG